MATKKVRGDRGESEQPNGGVADVAGGEVSETPTEGTTETGRQEPIIDPSIIGEATGDSFEFKPKRRGRKPKTDKEEVTDLSALLWMVHEGLSAATGIEYLKLAEEESKKLAHAIARVQAFYPNSTLAPIAMAWVGLIVTAGGIYVPRVIAYKNDKGKKKGPKVVTQVPLPL